jgi:hypothetical protein
MKVCAKHLAIIIIALMAGLSACTDFFARVDKQNDWLVSEQEQIVLHTRPANFSFTESPNQSDLDLLLHNQNYYIQMICDTLGVEFNEMVLIYLFNSDEALDAIGTQTGGHAIPDRSAIYYSFVKPAYTDIRGMLTYMGAHEMVHIITHRLLGKPFSKMMSEGYATAIDGAFGLKFSGSENLMAKPVSQWMNEHFANNLVLTPDQLLFDTDQSESVYYPNAAFFISYLWQRFGVETINHLFLTPSNHFKNRFRQITGLSFDLVANDYLEFVEEQLR